MMENKPEPKGGWTPIDNTPRCNNCFNGDDGMGKIGTPLSVITVKVSATQEPFIDIAKATICRKCDKLYAIKVLPMAQTLNISLEKIEKCLLLTRNADAFKINELQSGQMDDVKFSPNMLKLISKFKNMPRAIYKNKVYQPDKFIQQKMITEDLPL